MDTMREPRITALMENFRQGLLWVTQTGHVLCANAQAVCATGLRTGARLPPGELLRAVVQSVQHQVPREARLVGRPDSPGDLVPELVCRTLPGLADEDAFVLLGDPGHAPALDASLLMQLLADDLAPPLQRVQSALSIARQEGDEHACSVLLETLEGLLVQLGQVVDVGRLWTSPITPDQDRLDLMALIQQAWADVEHLGADRVVRLKLTATQRDQALAPVYGSAPGLRQVLRHCLTAAIQVCTPGSLLRLDLRQMGPRIQIVFVDCPAFAGLPLREPAPGRAAPALQRRRVEQQTRWHLCRRILSLHGGQLREEHESGARNFMVDLPCGAPFPADNPGLDVEQAHRYARDLAALMAQSRRQGGSSPMHTGVPA